MNALPTIDFGADILHRALVALDRGPSVSGQIGALQRMPEEGRLRAGSQRLHYLEWPGQGPPMVLLHGLNNSAWIWARVASLLADGRRVLSITQRGHGSSSRPRQGYGLLATSQDLRACLDALELERVHLAGHSWGGKVCCHFATAFGGRLLSLTLADPAPPKGLNPLVGSSLGLINAVFAPERGPFPDRASWEAGMTRLAHHQAGDETDRLAWQAIFHERPDGSWHPRLRQEAFEEIVLGALPQDLRPQLPRISCPVLLLLPSLGLSFLPGEWRALRRAAPLRVKRIVGNHTFVHSNPVPVACELARFMERTEDRQG